MSTDGPFTGTYLCPKHSEPIPCLSCRVDKYLVALLLFFAWLVSK